MQSYELTVVLAGKTTLAKKKAVSELIEKLVKTNKGKVKKMDDWGKIGLAYQISKNDSGIFLFFELELKPEAVKAIGDKLGLEEDIIRYLLVRKE